MSMLSDVWSDFEDDILWKAAKKDGVGNWANVIHRLHSKTPENCDQRWKFLQRMYIQGKDNFYSDDEEQRAPQEEKVVEVMPVIKMAAGPSSTPKFAAPEEEEQVDDDELLNMLECQRHLKEVGSARVQRMIDLVRSTPTADESGRKELLTLLELQLKLIELPMGEEGKRSSRKRKTTRPPAPAKKRLAITHSPLKLDADVKERNTVTVIPTAPSSVKVGVNVNPTPSTSAGVAAASRFGIPLKEPVVYVRKMRMKETPPK